MKMIGNKNWNNGDLQKSGVRMKRARAERQARIDATGERVFAELPRLLASQGGSTRWLTTHQDEARHHYGAVLLQPELAIGKLEVDLAPSEGATQVCLSFCYTAITERGNELLDGDIDQRLDQLLERIAAGLRGEDVAPTELLLPAVGPPSETPDAFEPASRASEHELVVQADPDDCFALACPVAELDWIDGWQFHLVYSDSGRNEDDCIFLEAGSGLAVHRSAGATTAWYTTLYDPEQRRFHAVLLTEDFIVGRWALEVDDLGDGKSRFRWQLVYTGLSERGNRIIDERGFAGRIFEMQDFLARSAKRYLETGQIERLPAKKMAEVAISLVGATLARHFRRPRGSCPTSREV